MYRLFFILMFLPFLTQAQNSFAEDVLLRRISDSLPRGWTMVIKDSELIISRHDSVLERPDTMSARGDVRNYVPSVEEEKEELELFKKEGHRAMSRITYRLEPKWGPWTMMNAWRNNDSIENIISKLQEKYKIEGIYRRVKMNEEFSARTDDERERVLQYWVERKALAAQFINYPQHNSNRYSLFEKSATGIDNGFRAIWPLEAVREWYKVEELMLDILGRRVFR